MTPRVLFLLTDELSAVLVRGQFQYFIDAGFSVSVATRMVDPADPSSFDLGVDVHHICFARQPAPLQDLRALWQTIALIRRLKPNIVHASTPKAGLIGMIAARVVGVAIRVLQIRGLRYETESGTRRRLFRWFERVSISQATDVLFNSRSSRDLAERERLIEPGRALILGSSKGVDTRHFSPAPADERDRVREAYGLPSNARVITFVGRLTKGKGIDDLVDIFASFEEDDIWLLIVGSLEDGDPVSHETAAAIESHPRIVRQPWLDDTRPAFAVTDVLAFPSYREGLPNVPLQAQACAVPVVGYAATGTVDAVIDGETGILVPTGNRAALKHALHTVLFDGTLRSQLGLRGRQHMIESFQPDAVGDRIVQCYRQALAR